MNFQEILAKLGVAAASTLTDARALLLEATTALGTAASELTAAQATITTLQESVTALNLSLDAAKQEMATHAADLSAAQETAATAVTSTLSALAAAGLKVEKLEPDAIKAAAHARAEALGHELLAARGIKPLPEQIKAAGDVVEAHLSSDDGILTAYEAMPTGPARVEFYAKHEAAIWRAFKK
jgi:uncharacterized phage infection (PIP) family protein YhgE